MGKLAKATPIPSRPGTRCSVAVLLDEIDDEDRDAVLGWLRTPDMQTSAIGRVLADHGHRMAHSTLTRHRKNACRCTDDRPEYVI